VEKCVIYSKSRLNCLYYFNVIDDGVSIIKSSLLAPTNVRSSLGTVEELAAPSAASCVPLLWWKLFVWCIQLLDWLDSILPSIDLNGVLAARKYRADNLESCGVVSALESCTIRRIIIKSASRIKTNVQLNWNKQCLTLL